MMETAQPDPMKAIREIVEPAIAAMSVEEQPKAVEAIADWLSDLVHAVGLRLRDAGLKPSEAVKRIGGRLRTQQSRARKRAA